ncbi:MAG: fasciclin domain-containing protein [Prevotellaceae bacterium]|nr:fasciclin domain-containing protein [Candidatus Minthosoma caballi]
MKGSKGMKTLVAIICAVFALNSSLFTLSSCSDDPDAENYYTFTGEMVSDYLDNRPEQFSQFVDILKRSGMYGMMATYGTYTCLAPTNEAVESYLRSKGKSSVAEMSKEECDTLAWNHIIKYTYFTTDLHDGNFPTANMNDRYLTFSCDSDATNGNNIIYFVNKASQLIARDDSVENGVVHTINKVIQPSSQYLPELIMDNPEVSIFASALEKTGLGNLMFEYLDETYTADPDSVNKGFYITRAGTEQHLCYLVGKRMKRFSAFIEPDSVFIKNNIHDLPELIEYAKEVYNEVYPEDAGKYDDDYTNRKNPLNRFVAYHLLPYYGGYDDWTVNDVNGVNLKSDCALTDKIDCTDWYTTLMPGTIMKMSSPTGSEGGLYINRKGVKNRASVRGVKVFSPSEIGNVDQQALNGIFHYIDDILTYNVKTRDVVFNDRIRIDAVTLSSEFMNCGARGAADCTMFKIVDGWDFHGQQPNLNLRNRGTWNATYQDAVDFTGQFDISFRLPPVPENTYEVRFAYGAHESRGVVQVYFGEKDKLEPMGIPIDFRIYGADPTIGWVADTGDKDADAAIDKAMHNRGYMKEMDTWQQGGANNLRENNGKLRKILCTQTMSPDKEYWIRIRLVNDNPKAELPINYFELCPKSVYAGLTAEDTH